MTAEQKTCRNSAVLGDLPIQIIDGDRSSKYPKREEFLGSGVYFLNTTNIVEDRLDLTDVNYVSEAKFQEIRKGRIQQNDILLTTRGSIGKVALVGPTTGRGLINAQMLILRPDESCVCSTFLYYFLRSPIFRQQLKNFSSGSAQPQIPITDLKRMTIPLPSIEEQRRIAGILSAYDDLIENCQRRIEILEEMARSLYREWFVHFRYPGHESVPLTPSPLGPIPEGWEITLLGDLIELVYGKALKQEDRKGGEIPVYGSSGVVGYHDSFLAKGPGIIIGRKGNVGSVFWSSTDFFVIDTAYFVKSELPISFLFEDLKTKNFLNNDAAVPGLSRAQAYSLKTLKPPVWLLNKYDEFASQLMQLMTVLDCERENLKSTRDNLLEKLIAP